MASQTDYIIAIGIFLMMFAVFVQLATSYFATVRQTTHVETLRSEAFELLRATERPLASEEWRNESIGLATTAFRFVIMVNNSAGYMVNQSDTVRDLASELVSFNITLPVDNGSIAVYDDNGAYVPYMLDMNNFTFAAQVSANSIKNFTVYFDDDSNFTSRSSTISGSSNLTERALNPEEIVVIQRKRLQQLNSSSYELLRQGSRFSMQVLDAPTNATVMQFGEDVPSSGDVVALQKFVIYQNATAGIKAGRIMVRTW